jgi:hypothetical protein
MVIDPGDERLRVEAELEEDFWQRCRLETQEGRAAFRGIRADGGETVVAVVEE